MVHACTVCGTIFKIVVLLLYACNLLLQITNLIDQREYYEVAIHASPIQKSHAIGSVVTLNCTITPSPQNYENFTFPLTYRWYFPDRTSSYYGSTPAITVASAASEQSFGYCLIYRYSASGLLLGQERTVLITKGNISANSVILDITK